MTDSVDEPENGTRTDDEPENGDRPGGEPQPGDSTEERLGDGTGDEYVDSVAEIDEVSTDEPVTALDVPTSFAYEEDNPEKEHPEKEPDVSVEPDTEAPLDTLVSEIDRKEGPSSDLDELFDREAVEDVDSEQLWEQVEEGTVDPVDGDEREIREISKSKYCHGCDHFSAPPEVACLHEGSEILDLSTLETFRVANCPVVLKDEELERKY